MSKHVIIIGAGPAGLTAAYELVTKTELKPVIIEMSDMVGGISRTEVYKGNRIDIGGHRFFSKSETIMKWWQNILPIQGGPALDEITVENEVLRKRINQKLVSGGPDPSKTDQVMLIRSRLSRIYFLRKFFDYPISINWQTISSLGFYKLLKIGFAYIQIRLFPIKNVVNLEDFFISRFGKELYETFFKDYTEKVWGVPCKNIDANWGAQRIKELSVSKALFHVLKSVFVKDKSIEQKHTETSLIEQFMYPKLGPGQMWETVLSIVKQRGGEIIFNSEVTNLKIENKQVSEIVYFDHDTNSSKTLTGDYFLSTMPVKHLLRGMGNYPPKEVIEISEGLKYRDFITVGLLLNSLELNQKQGQIKDNWIYIQEKEVKLGRLQIYNNWSPYLVSDTNTIWLGLEYFCNEGDALWEKKDKEFIDFAIDELVSIGIIKQEAVLDATVIKVPKAYPAYFGTYSQFDTLKRFTDSIQNLFLVGRNGMHKYNNQDHSMLTAMKAVENIVNGVVSKENIWEVNVEKEYHETK